MISTEARNQFLILSKSATGKACESFISQLISNPHIFIFKEFLVLPNIKELQTSSPKYYDLLHLFTYGTYQDYAANTSKYPPLTDTQLKKLRQLTLIDIASKQKLISYEDLSAKLDIKDQRELEDLVIDTIYSGLLEGKLNQKERLLKVLSVKARDPKDDELQDFVAVLKRIQKDAHHMFKNMGSEIDKLNHAKAKYLENRRKLDEERNKALEKAKQQA